MNEHNPPDQSGAREGDFFAQFDDYIVGPGAFMGVKGRFIYTIVNRTESEQREHLKAMAASKDELKNTLEKSVCELEAILNKYNPFDVIANLFMANAVFDPETYEEPLFEGRIAFIEYVTLLLMAQSRDRLTWTSTELIDGPALADIQERVKAIFHTTIWLFMVNGIDPDEPRSPTEIDELRFKSLADSLIVRFPAYHHHMRDILTQLFTPLAQDLLSVVGFTIADALSLTDAINKVVTEKIRAKVDAFRGHEERLLKAVKKYRTRKQASQEIRLEVLQELAKVAPSRLRSQLNNRTVAATMFGIGEEFAFTPEELAAAAEVDLARTKSFLGNLCLEFGSVEERFRHPSPTQPLLTKPIIRHEDSYICPVPQSLAFSLRHAIEAFLRSSSQNSSGLDGYWKRYEACRRRYTEITAVAYLRKCLCHASAYENLFYETRDEDGCLVRAELDGLLIFDTIVFLIEAKAGTVSLPTRRGAPDRMKRDMKELVEVAYDQALRAKRYIQGHDRPKFVDSEGREVVIDKSSLDKILLVTVTLESLDVFVTALYKLKGLGLFGSAELPWAASLSDLRIICEMIEFPSQLVHYLERRKRINELGLAGAHDETDWLGHYLREGLYFEDLVNQPGAPTAYNLLSHSSDFDSYYLFETGQRTSPVEKPRQKMPATCRRLVRELEARHPLGYSRACFFILDLSDDSKQQLASAIELQIQRTKADNELHDFTLITESTKSGLSIMFSRAQRAREMQEKLRTYCLMKKYQTKSQLWVGIGICVDHPELMHCLTTTQFDWEEDHELSQLVSRAFPPGSNIANTPAEMAEILARMKTSR